MSFFVKYFIVFVKYKLVQILGRWRHGRFGSERHSLLNVGSLIEVGRRLTLLFRSGCRRTRAGSRLARSSANSTRRRRRLVKVLVAARQATAVSAHTITTGRSVRRSRRIVSSDGFGGRVQMRYRTSPVASARWRLIVAASSTTATTLC